jgi:GDP-D-mannose 3',5'-epimerase
MKCVVLGAGGFIGHHLVKRLKTEGHYVVGIDRKKPEFEKTGANQFNIWDLRQLEPNTPFLEGADEVYQLAAEMGGAGYCFTGENDAEIMSSSATINLKVLRACVATKIPRVFFSSSACVYSDVPPRYPNETNAEYSRLAACEEGFAYPANPDSDYGWEKLFSERLYQANARNFGLQVRIGRYHNIFGPLGTWTGGREKFPAAVCRKVAEAPHGTKITLWGDGTQQRSFTYIDDAVEGTIRLMRSDFEGPVNIGSSRMISIEDTAKMVIAMSQKWLDIAYEPGPTGVQGRNSDNTLILEKLGWEPRYSLEAGLFNTYHWVAQQVAQQSRKASLLTGLPPQM